MVDIIVGNMHKISRLNSNKSRKRSVFRGRIVGIRNARRGIKSKRDMDGKNAKAFIIIVDYNDEFESLLHKRVEIRVL